MRATETVAYTYRADNYHPACLNRMLTPNVYRIDTNLDTEDMLDLLARADGVDRTDEHTFDSDDFPKAALAYQVALTDTCGECGKTIR